jgi:hypothetical protein
LIYVTAPSIWGLIDLPLLADFLPAHPSDCFTIDLPNVPVAGAAVGVVKAIGEGPKAMEPSIVEIFTFLERTKKDVLELGLYRSLSTKKRWTSL